MEKQRKRAADFFQIPVNLFLGAEHIQFLLFCWICAPASAASRSTRCPPPRETPCKPSAPAWTSPCRRCWPWGQPERDRDAAPRRSIRGHGQRPGRREIRRPPHRRNQRGGRGGRVSGGILRPAVTESGKNDRKTAPDQRAYPGRAHQKMPQSQPVSGALCGILQSTIYSA